MEIKTEKMEHAFQWMLERCRVQGFRVSGLWVQVFKRLVELVVVLSCDL